ncbi:receptor-transporting protein 3-like [Mustelus asterias]
MARVPGKNPWIDLFSKHVENLEHGDKWTLNFNYKLCPDLDPEQREAGWKIYTTSSFGRFDCRCSNSWSSAHVVLLFHYRLRKNRGLVLLRLFRQGCRKCWNPPEQKPQVPRTKIENVFDRLIPKILKNCYGEKIDNVPRIQQHRKTKPHEKSLCEACALGICCNQEDVGD